MLTHCNNLKICNLFLLSSFLNVSYFGKKSDNSLKFYGVERESVCYLLAFLLAIIISLFRPTAHIPADERARGTVVEECRISVGRKNAYRFAPSAEVWCTCECASVPGARRGDPIVVTDERFYRTSRCNREACVILLSIPFSLLSNYIKLLMLKYIYFPRFYINLGINFYKV